MDMTNNYNNNNNNYIPLYYLKTLVSPAHIYFYTTWRHQCLQLILIYTLILLKDINVSSLYIHLLIHAWHGFIHTHHGFIHAWYGFIHAWHPGFIHAWHGFIHTHHGFIHAWYGFIHAWHPGFIHAWNGLLSMTACHIY